MVASYESPLQRCHLTRDEYFGGATFAQDAGLIFLSRMATDVATTVLGEGGSPDEAVATALAATAIATTSLGAALVLVGKLKLARFVAYLPMPVVSGLRL